MAKCLRILLLATLLWLTSVVWAAELMVCWGGEGDIPAVALLEEGREPRVLLPGGASDGEMMVVCLEKLGMLQVDVMLMPTVSPFLRGAAKIAAKCDIRKLAVLYNSRSRGNWRELRKKLTENGTAINEVYPKVNQYWRVFMGEWLVNYQRLKDAGTFRVSFFTNFADIGAPVYYFEQKVTGVFVVGRQDDPKPLLELPKSNRSGMKKVFLEGISSSSEK